MTIRVLLVDDHQIFREALRSLLDRTANIQVVGEAADGAEVARLARELSPNIVCMDISMPGLNGIEATRQLSAAFPEVKVIALSTHTDHVYVMDIMRAGAQGFVTKAEGGKELLRAIDAVMQDRQYLCPAISDVMTRSLFNQKEHRNMPLLGARERQVLCLVAKGLTSHQIGTQLAIASGTVDAHRRNIMRKLNVHNAVELTRYAITLGFVSD